MNTTVTPAMRRKAEKLAELLPTFARGCDKTSGIQFVIVPGTVPNVGQFTNGLGCTCDGFDKRGVCTHSLAVQIHDTRESEKRIAAAQAKPKPLKTYEQLYPVCPVVGCDEDALRSGYCLGHRELAAPRPFVNGRIDASDVFELSPLAE